MKSSGRVGAVSEPLLCRSPKGWRNSILRSFAACFLCFVTTAASAKGGGTTGGNIHVAGLEKEGISVISSIDPQFTAQATLLAGELFSSVLELRPYVVVVCNHSERTIVAYTLVWDITPRHGRGEKDIVEAKYPDAVAGLRDIGVVPLKYQTSREIPSGGCSLSSMDLDFQFGATPLRENQAIIHDVARDYRKWYGRPKRLSVSLVAVIFDDGSMAGADETALEKSFMLYVDAKQDLFSSVVEQLDQGLSVSEVFQNIRSDPPPPFPEPDMKLFWQRIAAQEIIALRLRIGDQAVHELFKQAIRNPPFVVRGPNPQPPK